MTLALLALGGCDTEGEFEHATDPELVAQPESVPPTTELRSPDELGDELPLVVLGGASAILDELADATEVVFEDELDGPVRLSEARALALDVASSTSAQRADWKPLFDTAWRQRLPIVMTNIDNAAAMAELVGFGIEADVVIAESLAPSPGFRLRTLGEVEEVEEVDGVDAGTRVVEVTGRVRAAETVEILAEIDAVTGLPEIAASGSYPIGSYAQYIVAPSGHSTSISNDTQVVTRNIGFRVELFVDANTNRKLMVVNEEGSGINAGNLYSNVYHDRGYYQEQVAVDVVPLHDGLSPQAHAPLGVNGSHTFGTRTNWSTGVSVSGGVPTLDFSFGGSNSQSVTMADFTVLDESSLNATKWRFRMNATEGGAYTDYSSLLDDDDRVHLIPALARTTLVPEFETVYQAEGDFESIARVKLDYDVHYEHVWNNTGGDHSSFDHGHKRNVAIDFGRVNLPRAGTLPMEEGWSEDSLETRWHVVNEAAFESANWTAYPGNFVHMTGNAWSIGPDGLRRGTYVQALDSYMGDGTLVANIYPYDDDTWGYMYGIQDSTNYYRAVVDRESNHARIVKFEDGVGTILGEVPYQAPINVKTELRLVRSGSAHHLYVAGVKQLTVHDATFGTGSIALFSAAMSGIWFGRIHLLRTNEPDVNLAFGHPTTQSSTAYEGSASRAVDGGTAGHYSYESVTHTDSENQPWWRVDLSSMRTVNDITVWNRTDCCTSRLSNYTVELLDDNLDVVASRSRAGTSPRSLNFDMGGAVGRYVRVRLDGSNYLSLAEVEVWGPPK